MATLSYVSLKKKLKIKGTVKKKSMHVLYFKNRIN